MFGDYSCFPPNFLYSMCKGQLHIRDMYWFLRILSFGMLFLLYREHIYTGVTMVTKKHALWGSIKASFPVILLCTVDVSHQSFQFRQLKRDYLWLRRAQPFSSHLQNPDFFFLTRGVITCLLQNEYHDFQPREFIRVQYCICFASLVALY